ncbi:hypothetical protein GAYE_SCF13G3446 [Galdieria yellowstonensis]|uniref:HMA domain-containing protein n=1 Tax=Galdieria yellowstonensis TaxID=3028027 RepID=A0AAV9IE71_9RHOD|nr:hypothetical protein GAYE_SCF13G3446 [Galdieria yellowstonensis]
MTCSSCAKSIENILYKQDGVHKVSVNVVLGSVIVQGHCREEQLVDAIESIGFKVVSCIPETANFNNNDDRSFKEKTVMVPNEPRSHKEDSKRGKPIQIRTGIASVEEYSRQVPTTRFLLKWNNAEAAEKCAELLKALLFVQQVSIATEHDSLVSSVPDSSHFLAKLVGRWKQYCTKKLRPNPSIYVVTVVAYDFRNFEPDTCMQPQFDSWKSFVTEIGSFNIKAALYAYLLSQLPQFSWQTDCQVDVVSSTHNPTLHGVIEALQNVEEEGKKWKYRFLLCLVCCIFLFLILVVWSPFHFLWLQVLLASLVQWIGGYPFYTSAFHVCRHSSRRANMAVLITTSSFIAYFYSLWLCFSRWFFLQDTSDASRHWMPLFETGSMLITVVLFGKWIESILQIRASRELEQIGEWLPCKVNLVLSKEPQEKPVNDVSNVLVVLPSNLVEPEDILLVESGQTIPVDGKILFGTSFVDESFLTGEACTVHKSVNDHVYAGAVNISHPLGIQATSVGAKTRLEEIWRLWNETQVSKAPSEAIVDKISALFVPTILCLSVGVFICWWLCLQFSIVPVSWWEKDGKVLFCLYFCLSAMVIACPCALGLAAPMAYMIASFTALQHGIVYREVSCLIDFVEDVRNIVFDKTGTLTLGKPLVTQCHVLTECILWKRYENTNPSMIWKLVEEIESQCVHPVARAVTEYARQQLVNKEELDNCTCTLSDIREQTGMGMEAEFRCATDEKYYSIVIGQKDWVLTQCLRDPIVDQSKNNQLEKALIRLEQLSSRVENETLLLIAIDNIPTWLLMIQDAIRPEAPKAVQWLQNKLGVQCWLLSGDNYKSAKHVANVVGIPESHVMAKLQPWQKWQWIQSKMEQPQPHENTTHNQKKSRIVFVGDGLNDAPALAQADIGIAMGTSTPLAQHTAAVVLKRNDLCDVITALDLAKKLKKTIYWNYGWAMLYNLLAFPVAAGLLYPLWRIRIPPFIAAAAMGFSSISVMLSSLRLGTYRSPLESFTENGILQIQPKENEATEHLMG